MWTGGRAGVAVAMVMCVGLAGCASSGVSPTQEASAEQIAPIQNAPVATTDLPAVGEDGTITTATLGQPATLDTLSPPSPLDPNAPVAANANGNFVTLDSVGSVPSAPGRDLSGGVTIEKLLGGWTVVSGATQCKLNLTYTKKTGTDRYRASTPGCPLPGLNVVVSWQLVGSQVQLFDEANDIIASLILSGNRFIGTLAGGQGISMVG